MSCGLKITANPILQRVCMEHLPILFSQHERNFTCLKSEHVKSSLMTLFEQFKCLLIYILEIIAFSVHQSNESF